MRFSVAASTLLSLSTTAVLAAPFGAHGLGQETDVRVIEAAESPASSPSPSPSPEPQESDAVAPHQSGGEEYVVIFDVDKPTPPEVEQVLTQLNLSADHSDVKYTFTNSAFRGFVANMQDHCLDLLDKNTDVSMVEKSVSISSLNTRGGSPWGLQRVSSTAATGGIAQDTSFTYTFDGQESSQGQGVDIYIVDTGVNTQHKVFGGRAQQGFSFEQDTTDGDGHGTHVAGTAAGAYFGVASGANVFAVKVLGADGSGSSADTIAGMNWVINHHDERKSQPGHVGAIMSMSWGLNGISPAVDTAIKTATGNGIHVSVAAGNAGADSCSSSPSSSAGTNGPAIAVGSMGIEDVISSFSNSGACNDVYGPGENILSAWPTADNMVNFLSGTSMACPHVTGVMAYLMTEHSELAKDPAAMKTYLATNGLPKVITGKANSGDPVILVNNDEKGGSSKTRRTINIRDEATTPIAIAREWASNLINKFRRDSSDEASFVLKRALSSGPQLRY